MTDTPDRVTILAKSFTEAAMEFHRSKMSERGYRMEGRIEPHLFQVVDGMQPAKDLFDGEPYFAVTFVRKSS
ncbi:MAG: AMP nucleosidase [Robiginitomaculum sp.]|nr:AMP nucleosidase [Robiginitomaculum sp.]